MDVYTRSPKTSLAAFLCLKLIWNLLTPWANTTWLDPYNDALVRVRSFLRVSRMGQYLPYLFISLGPLMGFGQCKPFFFWIKFGQCKLISIWKHFFILFFFNWVGWFCQEISRWNLHLVCYIISLWMQK